MEAQQRGDVRYSLLSRFERAEAYPHEGIGMNTEQIAELLGQSVAKVTEQLPALDRESLVELQAQEIAGQNRSTLLAAVDAALVALDNDDGDKNPTGGGDGKGDPAPKGAGKLSTDDWRHPEYAGALSGEQADWRVRNIKPVREARTK